MKNRKNAIFLVNSGPTPLMSNAERPECHNGAAYSAFGLKIDVQALISSLVWKPNCLSLLIINIFLLTLEHIRFVFSVQLRSFEIITPNNLTLSVVWMTLLFKWRVWGAWFNLLKSKLMILHFFSYIIMLFTRVCSNQLQLQV